MCLYRIRPEGMGYLLKTCSNIESGQQTEREDGDGS